MLSVTGALFPASAGMNRRWQPQQHHAQPVPRVSGDEPDIGFEADLEHLLFPASAGMNRCPGGCLDPCYAVPRVSGDEPVPWESEHPSYACSPRQRG